MPKKKKQVKFWQTPKFKKLQGKWEERLKKAGFNDIEKTVDGEKYLRVSHKEFTNADSRWEYFDQIEKKALEAQYDSEVERIILNKFAAGMRPSKIQEDLFEEGVKILPWSQRVSRVTIRKIIRKYEDRWGIRSWKKKTTV